jgi:hypothetical protein
MNKVGWGWILTQTGFGVAWLVSVAWLLLESSRYWTWLVGFGGIGVVLTTAQALVLPATLRHERVAWLGYNSIGALGGAVLLWAANWYADDIIGLIGYGLCTGLTGWAVLRDSHRPARRWIFSEIVGYVYMGLWVRLGLELHKGLTFYTGGFPLWGMLLIGLAACLPYAFVSRGVIQQIVTPAPPPNHVPS